MTTLETSGEHSMDVTIGDEGASLSVHFSYVRFPHLFGYDAHAESRYDGPRWVYVPDDPKRPKLTEKQGRFAPFKKVRVFERDPEVRGEECTLEFRFDSGATYNRCLRVRT